MALSSGEITAIVVGAGNIVAWAKLFYDMRKNGGRGIPCPLHQTLAGEIKTLHTENREEHHQIFSDIKSLALSVQTASEAARTAAAAAASIWKRDA